MVLLLFGDVRWLSRHIDCPCLQVPVYDRRALIDAVNASVSAVVKLRLEVTEAVASTMGNECAMQ